MAKQLRPTFLFSMDSDQFCAPPTTTGGLLSYFNQEGESSAHADVRLVHFQQEADIEAWWSEAWNGGFAQEVNRALAAGIIPVAGFSCYTWNTDLFLQLMDKMAESCPGLLIIAGGPQVQKPEDYLGKTPIDVIALGEAEVTFCQLMDAQDADDWADIAGLAYLHEDDGQLVRTEERVRSTQLDEYPSALDVVPLRDAQGKPLYTQVAYETARGCPFKCAYCEWGTGAIGTKMYQFSLQRIRSDMRRLVDGGIQDIWLSDSNFGALREDLEKTKIIVALREETGLPYTFATSWSKSHNSRVQEIVLLLQRNGLLQNYNLALQTLTPLALKLSNRTNMRSNRYEPIAKEMTRAGVPIATELIWGLPGDTLAEFESNLDRLLTFFPNINIFGYTLLPGTEFYEKREEYKFQTVPVAGYGAAKGEYVVGCHTFGKEEGLEGYFLIAAHILLIRGHMMPFTIRLMALDKTVPVSAMLRPLQNALLRQLATQLPDLDLSDRMAVYEHRAAIYLAALTDLENTFQTLEATLMTWLEQHEASEALLDQARKTMQLDRALCPRTGKGRSEVFSVDFDMLEVERTLGRMDLPAASAFESGALREIEVQHPAHVGEVLKDPDGGTWFRGKLPACQAPSAETQTQTVDGPGAATGSGETPCATASPTS